MPDINKQTSTGMNQSGGGNSTGSLTSVYTETAQGTNADLNPPISGQGSTNGNTWTGRHI